MCGGCEQLELPPASPARQRTNQKFAHSLPEAAGRDSSTPFGAFLGLIAILVRFTLGLQYVLLVIHPDAPVLIGGTANYFSYFTILTNLIATISMSAAAMPIIASRAILLSPNTCSSVRMETGTLRPDSARIYAEKA